MSQRAIVGSARRQAIADEISPQARLFKRVSASEARQAVGEAAVVKVAPTWVHVVNASGVVHMCPGGPACPQPAPAGPWCTALAALAYPQPLAKTATNLIAINICLFVSLFVSLFVVL